MTDKFENAWLRYKRGLIILSDLELMLLLADIKAGVFAEDKDFACAVLFESNRRTKSDRNEKEKP